jgi:hypothetical protein
MYMPGDMRNSKIWIRPDISLGGGGLSAARAWGAVLLMNPDRRRCFRSLSLKLVDMRIFNVFVFTGLESGQILRFATLWNVSILQCNVAGCFQYGTRRCYAETSSERPRFDG